MTDNNIPVDQDGVPLYGPMADYVSKATREAIQANLARMKTTGMVDIRGDKDAVRAARRQAIAEWNANNPSPAGESVES